MDDPRQKIQTELWDLADRCEHIRLAVVELGKSINETLGVLNETPSEGCPHRKMTKIETMGENKSWFCPDCGFID